MSFSARWMVWVLGIRVNLIGIEEFKKHGNALLAGNHLSYLDIIVIGSNIKTCYVTSTEIRETPGLGHICLMAGCLFVERRNRSQLHKEIDELKQGLERGLDVTIFPEATSTNGDSVLRFRRPLFLSAVKAQKPVVPICVNYRTIAGETVSLKNRVEICWYGDMPFGSHLWNVCARGPIEVDLNFLPGITPKPDEDPGEVALKAQTAVESVFHSLSN